MAELTHTKKTSELVFGKKVGENSGKSEPIKDSFDPSPQCSLVYVRYNDHVIYKNILQPIAEAAERETVGWLTQQNEEIMLIEHDRTIPNAQIPCGQGNGIIILKDSILEIYSLPLQKNSNWHLNSQKTKVKVSSRFSQRSEKLNPKQGKDKQ